MVLIKLWFCNIICRMVWSSPCTKLAIFSISIVVRLFPSPFSATMDVTKLWSFQNFQHRFHLYKKHLDLQLKISLSFGWFSFWSEFLNFSSSVLHSVTVCLVKSTNWSHSRAVFKLNVWSYGINSYENMNIYVEYNNIYIIYYIIFDSNVSTISYCLRCSFNTTDKPEKFCNFFEPFTSSQMTLFHNWKCLFSEKCNQTIAMQFKSLSLSNMTSHFSWTAWSACSSSLHMKINLLRLVGTMSSLVINISW